MIVKNAIKRDNYAPNAQKIEYFKMEDVYVMGKILLKMVNFL